MQHVPFKLNEQYPLLVHEMGISISSETKNDFGLLSRLAKTVH